MNEALSEFWDGVNTKTNVYAILSVYDSSLDYEENDRRFNELLEVFKLFLSFANSYYVVEDKNRVKAVILSKRIVRDARYYDEDARHALYVFAKAITKYNSEPFIYRNFVFVDTDKCVYKCSSESDSSVMEYIDILDEDMLNESFSIVTSVGRESLNFDIKNVMPKVNNFCKSFFQRFRACNLKTMLLNNPDKVMKDVYTSIRHK